MSERPRADLEELVDLVAVLRDRCPWDARQTPRSLVTYLIEETGEVVDAVEVGTDEDLVEELGDLLLQVVLHARIAEQQGRFDIRDVAGGIVTKLRRRHPQFFPDGITLSPTPVGPPPDDLDRSWEARKAVEKGRHSSLDGIAESLSALARAVKVIARVRKHRVAVDLPTEALTAEQVGYQILALAARAQAHGIDADQATREAVRRLEERIRGVEHPAGDRAENSAQDLAEDLRRLG